MLWESLALLSIAAYFLRHWITVNNDYFKKRGIPYDTPFPLLGSWKETTFRKKSFFDAIVDVYKKHDGPIYGIFEQRDPLYLIRDPELVKQITVKDFDHFVNHRNNFGVGEDNLFGNSLFQIKDSKWRDMRNTLSPAFTGSKMRQMFQLMNQVAEESIKYLKEQNIAQNAAGELDFEMKDFCTRFSNDIIATTAFGIQVNSFENKTNEFYTMGKKVTTFTFWQNIKFLIFTLFKKLMEFLNVQLFDKKSTEYFRRLVLDAMKYRKEHNIHRPDMINMLMEARGMIKSDNPRPHNREWTDTEIVAQCFLFFFAGFDTTAVLMCFAAHELMENPMVQQKLHEEVKEVNEQLNGETLTYEALQNMRYMDMVVSETLRKWPPVALIDRECKNDYKFHVDGKNYELKEGESIYIPVVGLHRDPKYFAQPEKFNPERFSEENKDKILPFTYMPFGTGPRSCIASRFALLEAKAMLYYLLRDFRIKASKKSSVPLVLSSSSFQLEPKTGFWLKLITRKRV